MPAGAVYYENEISETSAEELSKHIVLLKSQLGKIEMVSFFLFCFTLYHLKNKKTIKSQQLLRKITLPLCSALTHC